MVIEEFREGHEKVYERLNRKGRMLPAGLHYLNSWVNKEENLCFQLMETNNPDLLTEWVKYWEDLIDFEIVPID